MEDKLPSSHCHHTFSKLFWGTVWRVRNIRVYVFSHATTHNYTENTYCSSTTQADREKAVSTTIKKDTVFKNSHDAPNAIYCNMALVYMLSLVGKPVITFAKSTVIYCITYNKAELYYTSISYSLQETEVYSIPHCFGRYISNIVF